MPSLRLRQDVAFTTPRGGGPSPGRPEPYRRSCVIAKVSHRRAPDGAADSKIDGRIERGLRRRRALIDAARELFLQHGYKGTTLEAIIAKAGGSRETIYQTFGDKRGLFGAIISEVGGQLAASVVEPDALQLPPREGLTRMGLQLMAIWSSDEARAVHRVVMSEGIDTPEIVEVWYRGGTQLSHAALTRYLTHQCETGMLEIADPAAVARQFLMLLMAEAAFGFIAGSEQPLDPEGCVDRTVDLLLRAYRQKS